MPEEVPHPSQILTHAERHYLLESPNADLLLRAASFFLSALLFVFGATLVLRCVRLGFLVFGASGTALWQSGVERVLHHWLGAVCVLGLVFALVQASLEYVLGATPGQLLLGLRLVRVKEGQREIDFGEALWRECVLVPFVLVGTLGIGVLRILWASDRATWIDQWSGIHVKRIR